MHALAFDTDRLRKANIHPETLLATDYLNHFNEAIMMLDMLALDPGCLQDLAEWRPKTYREHFTDSNFKDRDLAIAAYEASDSAVRHQLDDLADLMNLLLASTCEAMQRQPDYASATAEEVSAKLKPLVAKAGAVINGASIEAIASAEGDATQACVDAMFE